MSSKRKYGVTDSDRTAKRRKAVASIQKQFGSRVSFAGRQNYRQAYASRFSANSFRRIGVETKCLDLQFTGAYNAAYTADTQPAQVLNFNTGTACVQSLNLIQQGAGISQRIGNKVSLKSLRLRLMIRPLAANTIQTATHARFMVLYDRNPNGSYVAANAILGESLQSNTIGTGTLTSNLNPNFFDRFVVLLDEMITLQPFDSGVLTGTSNVGPTEEKSFSIDRFLPLKNLECVYNGTANPMTIAYQNTGSLQILTLGVTAGGADTWTASGSARLRFHDN